jgi:uncharacterized protein (DUF427 family)
LEAIKTVTPMIRLVSGLSALFPARSREPAVPAPDDIRVEPVADQVRIGLDGRTLVDTQAAFRVVGAGPAPFFFVPAQHVDMNRLHISERSDVSDWGGRIAYFHLIGPAGLIPNAVWFFPDPAPGLEAIRLHLAFYPQAVDEVWVGRTRVSPYSDAPPGAWDLPEAEEPARRVLAS